MAAFKGNSDTGQLKLFAGYDEKSLAVYFERKTGRPISLTITDNSTSMLSARKKDGQIFIRIHRMFLRADGDTLAEIAGFIKAGRGKTPLLRAFVHRNRDSFKKHTAQKVTLVVQGRHYNIKDLYNALNNEYFGGRITAFITWGTRSTKHSVRKRTLGSYNHHTNIIRINPVLDKKSVPLYFIAFVIYHEMLHAEMGVERRNGRRSIHTKEFRRRERMFRDYERAAAWERNSF